MSTPGNTDITTLKSLRVRRCTSWEPHERQPRLATLASQCEFIPSVKSISSCKTPAWLCNSIFAILAWGVAFVSAVSGAATLDSEEQRRRLQQEFETRQIQQDAPAVRLEKALEADTESLLLPAETRCFQIDRLRLAGKRLEEFSWAQAYLDQYANRCIGKEGVNLILRRLSAQILSRGYSTTRAGIPEQDMSRKELVIQLLPGIIREIRFADSALWGTWRTAFPVRAGDLLNIRDLEQGLEQMKRIPSQDIDMEIVPGEEQGESDIVIKIKREKPWKITLSLDDSGSRATGKTQAGINLAYDNPLGLNDLFNISINTDAHREGAEKGTKGNSLYYSLPWGYWTFTTSVGTSRYHQTVYGANQNFVSSGDSKSLDFRIMRLIHRDQSNKTSVQVKVAKRFGNSYINDTEIEVQRQNFTSGELSLIHRHYLGSAQLDVTLAYRQGVSWFNGQGDSADWTDGSPTRRYSLETLDIGLILPFKLVDQNLRYLSALRGQTSQNRLFGSEQFSIGSRYTVRGFDGENTLAADQGWYWRNELEIAIPHTPITAFTGLDHGQIAGRGADTQPGRRLTGTVLGLRGDYKGFSLESFASWALRKPASLQTRRPAVGFQMSCQF